VKLCDFGFVGTRSGVNLMVSYAGTPITMAPEILEGKEYDESCDMWSLGCVIYQVSHLFVINFSCYMENYPFQPRGTNEH
jgi:serine/threonine protein kinase